MNTQSPNKQAIIQVLQETLAGQADIIAAFLFGSVAQDKAHRQSDVDVAVLFDAAVDPQRRFELTLAIGAKLEDRLPVAVDVVALNNAPLLLQFEILHHGQLIMENDRSQRCLFQMRSMSRYYDAKPYLDSMREQTMRRIQEKGLGYGYHGNRNTLTEARRLRTTLASIATGRSN